MSDIDIRHFDNGNFTKENNYYIQLLYRILRKDGKPITEFNKDNYILLNKVQGIYDLYNKDSEIIFERAKIEVTIKIAAKDERDEVFTIEKLIKDDTGDFYAGD